MNKVLRFITPDDNYHLYNNSLIAMHTSHFTQIFGDTAVPFEFKIHFADCLLFINIWMEKYGGVDQSQMQYKYQNMREFLIIWEKKLTVAAFGDDVVSAFSKLIDNKNYEALLWMKISSRNNKLLTQEGNLLFPYDKVVEFMNHLSKMSLLQTEFGAPSPAPYLSRL